LKVVFDFFDLGFCNIELRQNFAEVNGGARIANLPHGGDRKSNQTANLQLDPDPQDSIFEEQPEVQPTSFGVSQSDAAELLNVGIRRKARR
jgi:hypothetical protein